MINLFESITLYKDNTFLTILPYIIEYIFFFNKEGLVGFCSCIDEKINLQHAGRNYALMLSLDV